MQTCILKSSKASHVNQNVSISKCTYIFNLRSLTILKRILSFDLGLSKDAICHFQWENIIDLPDRPKIFISKAKFNSGRSYMKVIQFPETCYKYTHMAHIYLNDHIY